MNWSLYKYVQKYFQNNFPEWYLMNNEQKRGFSKCVNELLEEGAKISDIKSGLHNNELSQKLNEYINNFFTLEERKDCLRLYEYIYDVISNSTNVNFKVKFNTNVIDYIVKQVMVEMYSQYHLSRLGTNDFEQGIIIKYKEKYNEMFKNVYSKIKIYLEKNVEFYQFANNNININDMIKYVSSQILVNNDYEFVLDVINMKTDDSRNKGSIENIIEKYKDEYISSCKKNDVKEEASNNIEQTFIIVDSSDYIRKLVLKCYTGVNQQLLNSCVSVVRNRLLNRGYTDNEIIGADMKNTVISFIDEFFKMRESRIELSKNSVKNNSAPSKIKAKRKKRVMNRVIIPMVLAATLISAGVGVVYQVSTGLSNINAKENVTMIDNHYYANINTIHAESFEPTADNIINTFDEYGKFGNENFQYLGFYQAYRSVKQDRLYIMDNMLSEIKRDVRNNDSHRNLSGSIMYNSCYLDFMYDRLYEMGFEDIKDDKYQDLLDAYLELKYEYPSENVVKYLSSSQEKLLEKVRDKYVELSEEYFVELGKLLGTDEYNISDSSRRSL